METVIRLEGLTKYYGKQLGIADLNLEVKSGEIFGFLGPNGAGKTTTIRLLLDLLRPTRGTATVLGLDAKAGSLEVRRSIGYIPSDPSLYGNLSGHDFLTYLANIRGGVQWSKVTTLAERLQCDLSRPIGALSRGNKQKLAVHPRFHARTAAPDSGRTNQRSGFPDTGRVRGHGSGSQERGQNGLLWRKRRTSPESRAGVVVGIKLAGEPTDAKTRT